MTAQQVKDLTSLDTREMKTDYDHEWLSCQIGKEERKLIQLSSYRTAVVPVFRLIAFGENWEIAYKMFLNRT